jgi:hypothetical protein
MPASVLVQALLVGLLCDASHAARLQKWWKHAQNAKASGGLYATGYNCEVLDYTWGKHGDELVYKLSVLEDPVTGEDKIECYFFLALLYIHHYPRWNKFIPSVLHTRKTGAISVQKFYSKIIPVPSAVHNVRHHRRGSLGAQTPPNESWCPYVYRHIHNNF